MSGMCVCMYIYVHCTYILYVSCMQGPQLLPNPGKTILLVPQTFPLF